MEGMKIDINFGFNKVRRPNAAASEDEAKASEEMARIFLNFF